MIALFLGVSTIVVVSILTIAIAEWFSNGRFYVARRMFNKHQRIQAKKYNKVFHSKNAITRYLRKQIRRLVEFGNYLVVSDTNEEFINECIEQMGMTDFKFFLIEFCEKYKFGLAINHRKSEVQNRTYPMLVIYWTRKLPDSYKDFTVICAPELV